MEAFTFFLSFSVSGSNASLEMPSLFGQLGNVTMKKDILFKLGEANS